MLSSSVTDPVSASPSATSISAASGSAVTKMSSVADEPVLVVYVTCGTAPFQFANGVNVNEPSAFSTNVPTSSMTASSAAA